MSEPQFIGSVITEWMADGRTMRLLVPFSFIDKYGYEWVCRENSIIDGSSIPRWLWTFAGSPFVGQHRIASVLHDVHCRIRIRPHQDVHKMYRDAAVLAGEPDGKADRKYWALLTFGPKWSMNGHDT